jgi:PHP family Zn ribbon phosphoesterase
MNENEVKNCPKCGGELEKGVMQASYVVFWNKDDVEEHLTSV